MSRTERFVLIVTVALGVFVRVLPVAAAPGATGDGGMFLAIVDDVRAAGGLPATATFNQLDIPFLYPPLAFLIGGAIGGITGADTLTVLHWVPVSVSILTIPALAWVAFLALPRTAALGATFAYALIPHSYDWVIAGGGLTRGMGLLFALLAMGVVADRRRPTVTKAITAGSLLGLSALAHPQTPIFGVCGALALSWQPSRTWLAHLAIAAAAAVVTMGPWLVWLAMTHDVGALATAGYRWEPFIGLIQVLSLNFSGAPFMDVFAVIGTVGVFACLARKEFRLPLLLLATYFTGAGGGEFMGAVAWALVAGVGIDECLSFMQRHLAELPRRRQRLALELIGALFLLLAMIGSVGSYADKSSKLQAISADHMAAMDWAAHNLPREATLIVPTNEWWGDDEVSEWIPALSHRRSYGTVQGSEWLGAERFEEQLNRHKTILECARSAASCYAAIDADAYLFIPKGPLAGPFSPRDCCPALRETLDEAGYRVIYDGPGATVAAP